jgi:hypothetical protein
MGTDPSAVENASAQQQEQATQDSSGGDHASGIAADDTTAAANADSATYAPADTAAVASEGDAVHFAAVGGDAAAGGVSDLGDDLVGVLTSLPHDMTCNIDHALDQLTTSTDLFDVPALDFHDTLPS